MPTLAILIPIVVVAWLCGLALVLALCVSSARSDRATTLAVRRSRAERDSSRHRRLAV
jgi:hypothetical protein